MSVTHLVVDAGAFIKNAPLQDIGENLHTIKEVVSEIRDKATRQRLQVLPYTLNFREPSTESIKIVTDFAKLTGDYPSLSAVDIRVLALTYQLEKEHVGTDHIKLKPEKQATFKNIQGNLEKTSQIEGFYSPKETEEAEEKGGDNIEEDHEDKSEGSEVEEEDDDDEEDEEDDDDDGGWITPSNITQKRLAMGDKNAEKAEVKVGCITTDFAMQNVLIQMGLHVVSVNGMLIKQAKSYVLRCHGCFKITTNMTRQFCHHCGNKTLQKVSVTVDDDGSIRYYLSARKPISTKGLKYSLPMPKGGKHSSNPILCEDQREAQQRMAKSSKVKYDVLDPDYEVKTSPFAPIDVTSRSAQLGIRDYKHNFKNRRNPNENKKVYGRRK